MQDTDMELAQWRRDLAEREEQWRAECANPLLKWRREAREDEDAVERETERRRAVEREMRQTAQGEIRSEDWNSWNAWADGRINAALERHEKIFAEGAGGALGEIWAGLRREFRGELEAATAKLGVDMRELSAGLRTELAHVETELSRRATNRETENAGFRLRGAYQSDQDYDRLDVVTVEGSSYIARQGSPGPCPGDGWRTLARAGSTGPQGERGPTGERGLPGLAGQTGPEGKSGAQIAAWRIDPASYSAFPIMTSGKEGPPLELHALFQRFFDEVC